MTPSVCFVALNAFDLISGNSDSKHIGGAEVQQFEIARWLNSRGYKVCFITKDQGQADGTDYNGISVYKAYDQSKGLPGLRFFTPRWSGLNSALRRAGADIYYQRGSGVETAQIAAWCKFHSKKFVFASASEGDCIPELPFLKRSFDRTTYRWGLSNADQIVSQTHRQKKLLKQNFNLNSLIICNVMKPKEARTRNLSNRPHLLWIGRLAPIKRIEWIIELSKRLPDIDFLLAGASNTGDTYSKNLTELLRENSNIKLLGKLNQEQMSAAYAAAWGVISTSVVEGFPNIFIESWYSGTPVICSYDPDDVVARYKLGWACSDLDQIEDAISSLLKLTVLEREAMAQHLINHAIEHHHPDSVLPEMQKMLDSLGISKVIE